MSRLVAVLTAAGSGSRLGCGGPKALVPLAHRPLLWWAARALVEAGATAIVVTAPAEAVAEFRSALEGVGAEVVVVAGSAASRQASVANGLGALPPLDADDVVLVHDAARPLTPPSMIRRVADAVRSGCDAVIPTVPVADTVKVVVPLAGGLGLVEGTPDRSSLAAVQTPRVSRGTLCATPIGRVPRAPRTRGPRPPTTRASSRRWGSWSTRWRGTRPP